MVTFDDEDPWLNDEPVKINSGHYHELLDRSYIFAMMLDQFINGHPATNDEMREYCVKAVSNIMMIHTLAAKKLYLE